MVKFTYAVDYGYLGRLVMWKVNKEITVYSEVLVHC